MRWDVDVEAMRTLLRFIVWQHALSFPQPCCKILIQGKLFERDFERDICKGASMKNHIHCRPWH